MRNRVIKLTHPFPADVSVRIPCTKSLNQVQSCSITDIVVTQPAMVFQSPAIKYKPLSVWWVLVQLVDILLHIPDIIVWVHCYGDHCSIHHLNEDFNVTW